MKENFIHLAQWYLVTAIFHPMNLKLLMVSQKQGVPVGKVNILGGHNVILNKKVYMRMCPIPKGFRDRAISLYISEIDKKKTLRTVSSIGNYCSSDKVGTVYLV
jgi:hypothetical protein